MKRRGNPDQPIRRARCEARSSRAAWSRNLDRACEPPRRHQQHLKGKVSRVLPGMQAAFIELASSARRSCTSSDHRTQPARGTARRAAPSPTFRESSARAELLVAGAEGSRSARKGAPHDLHAIPSRYLVLTPASAGHRRFVRVSTDDANRTAVFAVEELRVTAPEAGYIIRTAAEAPRAKHCKAVSTFRTNSGRRSRRAASADAAGRTRVR